jgi:hypothetical protein
MSNETAANAPRTNAGLFGCTHSFNVNFMMLLSWTRRSSSQGKTRKNLIASFGIKKIVNTYMYMKLPNFLQI